jgi:hypothetical protein
MRQHGQPPADRPLDRLSPGALDLEKLKDASRSDGGVMLYVRRELPPPALELLRSLQGSEPPVAVVCEDLRDVGVLRTLYAGGFALFYGFGLPGEPVIFFGRRRGFILDEHRSAFSPLAECEDLYFRLLWRRFGHAVSLRGRVKEADPRRDLFCLQTEDGAEHWCRLERADTARLPGAGVRVEVLAWERWGSRMLLPLEVREG